MTALILLVLAGCGGGPSVQPSSSAFGSAPASLLASPTSSASPSQESRRLTFELKPHEGSTAHGTVTIDDYGSGYSITVSVSGLAPGSHHTLDLDDGTCASHVESSGIVEWDVQADADGNLLHVTHYPTTPYEVPSSGKILMIHTEVGPSEYLACADLTN